jgi:hypothetical protein
MRPILRPCLCLALLALAACATPVRSTPVMVRSECRSSVSSSCFEFCDQYQALIEERKFASKVECRHACTTKFERQVAGPGGMACERAAGIGQDLCNLYCNQNYN